MPRRRRVEKRRTSELDDQQVFELILGPPAHGSAFASDDERRIAWELHRARFLDRTDNPGRRPWGWWQYESPEPRDHGEHPTLQLMRMGCLPREERAALEAGEWRLYEAQAQSVGGGDDARYWRHRDHHGIPKAYPDRRTVKA